MNKIVLFGGKGGVGKTTCSASYALNCARAGEKTLIVSTDPAHSIADIFGKSIGEEIIKLEENLYALEINSEMESKKYMNKVKGDLKNVLSPIIIKEINKQIDAAAISPGTEEAALFDKMVEIIIEKYDAFEKIVFDTAPTGHTVRLLSLPHLLGAWLDTLIEKRVKALGLMQMANNAGKKNKEEIMNDPVIKILSGRLDKINKVKDIIMDKEKVSFAFVLNAEKLPIEETKKAIKLLEEYKINVGYIVVNRILPDSIEGDFWKNKKQLEGKYLQEIFDTFKNKKINLIPMLNSDMGPNNISEIAKYW
ncbi:ArsA family ATPase [Anaerosalibacter sp. Marseille-P3206]|uniref:ArsA family ATPase n=1 Tax=Anaerosalibacter sp. Marseille-P3206 TaxID=1871005 RepID=UPI00190EE78F|nr:ArsA family ATPase [Anaerosalibacter sp. Marseille-P3206]